MHLSRVPRGPFYVEHCGTRGTFINDRRTTAVVGLVFVLLIIHIGGIYGSNWCEED
jgi:hypothetical protein